jgi:hypothetical protein
VTVSRITLFSWNIEEMEARRCSGLNYPGLRCLFEGIKYTENDDMLDSLAVGMSSDQSESST